MPLGSGKHLRPARQQPYVSTTTTVTNLAGSTPQSFGRLGDRCHTVQVTVDVPSK